jgi:hypothetical protein
MTISCFVFWTGVPAVTLWALGEVVESQTIHFLSALIAVPAMMLLTAIFLLWLNRLYLHTTGALRQLEADEEEGDWRRRIRGPLEPLLLLSLFVQLITLFVWFFFFAENPPIHVL